MARDASPFSGGCLSVMVSEIALAEMCLLSRGALVGVSVSALVISSEERQVEVVDEDDVG